MLAPGTRIGVYEVVSPLGAGGMGEVYRARDTALGREVALKTLPVALSSDPERLARLRREARLLASLNHPGIATLHGLEESGEGLPVLVMELVEGETLSDRLRRSPPGLKEALRVGHEVATALAAAHEKGVLHRDLKPANIRLAADGRVKLLDFGLARVLTGEGEELLSAWSTEDSPGTREGQIVGTAPYMSPEQARGEPLDRRADIWAYGCVLYEVLSGQRAFPGRTFSEAAAAVLEHEPDWGALPVATPPSIRKLLRRCLEKDTARRLHDVADAGLEFEDAQAELSSGVRALVPARPSAERRRGWVWAGGLTAAAVVGGVVVSLVLRSTPDVAPTIKRLTLSPPGRVHMLNHMGSMQHLAVSPDGRRVAFMGWVEGKGLRLYLQAIDDIEAHAIPGTEDARTPFFSPGGRWLAFQQGSQIRKLRLGSDDAPVAIAALPAEGWLRGASWGSDGTIVFAPGPLEGLWRVPAEGGSPTVLTRPDGGPEAVSHRWPQILPSGKDVLFAVNPQPGSGYGRLGLLSLETGQWRVVLEGSGYGRFSPSGHLVYARLGKLFAVPFDPRRGEATGPAVPVLDDVQMDVTAHFYADFDVSASGSLVYVPGFARPLARSLLWVDREGGVRPVSDARRAYLRPRISPDGTRLVVDVETQPGSSELWLLDLQREAWTLLTAEAGATYPYSPEWSSDGRMVAFVAGETQHLMRIPADGGAPAEQLSENLGNTTLNAWSPGGKILAFTTQRRGKLLDIGILPLETGQPRWLLSAPHSECCVALSPDGRFMAYVSNESGRYDVYVRPFPDPAGQKHAVSTEGGTQPRWSRDGKELFYRGLGERPKLMAVEVDIRGSFRAGVPRPLFDDRFGGGVYYYEAFFDVAPDGRSFVFVEEPPEAPAPTRLVLIPDWASELQETLEASASPN